MGWGGMGWDGMGCNGMGWDEMGWDGMGWDGIVWDTAGWGYGCDGVHWVGSGWTGLGWAGWGRCDAVPESTHHVSFSIPSTDPTPKSHEIVLSHRSHRSKVANAARICASLASTDASTVAWPARGISRTDDLFAGAATLCLRAVDGLSFEGALAISETDRDFFNCWLDLDCRSDEVFSFFSLPRRAVIPPSVSSRPTCDN